MPLPDYLSYMQTKEINKVVDVRLEWQKMEQCCEGANKKPTRSRFTIWLNNVQRDESLDEGEDVEDTRTTHERQTAGWTLREL